MKRALILIGGDALAYWAGLCLTLWVRWGSALSAQLIWTHAVPFGMLFAVFILICYAMQLYTLGTYVTKKIDWLVPTIASLFLFVLASSSFLYFYSRITPSFSPRGTLLLFWAVFSFLFIVWRMIAENFVYINLRERILIVGTAPELTRIEKFLREHPVSGMTPVAVAADSLDALRDIIVREKIQTIVSMPELIPQATPAASEPFWNLHIRFFDARAFCEEKLGKIQIDDSRAAWDLIASIKKQPYAIDVVQTAIEQCIACLCMVLCMPLFILITLCIVLTSRGPILYSQKRIGQNGRAFMLYKFRTMIPDAEKGGPQWAAPHDARVTAIGKILRYMHLDELPQLANIMKGDLLFVGPRPERPEFVQELQTHIPLYALRHIVKPGITGWAQLNYPYGASVDDAKEKLAYDLYYIKHKTALLDFSIALKTVRRFFQNPEQRA